MEDTRQLRDAFDAVNEFLYPVLNKERIQNFRGDSLIDILDRTLPADYCHDDTPRSRVVQRTLALLSSIHDAFVAESTDPVPAKRVLGKQQDQALEDAKRRRALHALLDLLSFEGIYPSLSSGVGIPLEKRVISVLPAGVIAKNATKASDSTPQYTRILDCIIGSLSHILQDARPSIQPIILGRILPDLVCGTAELAFNSKDLPSHKIDSYKRLLNDIIDKCSTPSLLPVLSSLLQESTAPWFKACISSQLSQIPLRKDGVFQIILFLASQFAPTLGQSTKDPSAGGPPITVQAIMQSSRLLSLVPQGSTPEEYFSNVAPKLLALLDGEDPDMKKTSSYVIGNGILGKRAYGSPGAIGFIIFAQPILDTFHGKISQPVTTWMRPFSLDGSADPEIKTGDFDGIIIVPECKLLLALERLTALATLHPSPGLLKRLVNPALLPLWGLQCYAKEHQKRSLEEKVSTLLQMFFSVSASITRLVKLADNILWDGPEAWVYGAGEEGGVSIRKRENREPCGPNILSIIQNLDGRVDSFLQLLAADPQKEEFVGDVFLHVSRQWLFSESMGEDGGCPQPHREQDKLQPELRKLVSAKIAEKLLDQFKESLSRHPIKVLELIRQLIESEKNRASTLRTNAQGSESISLQALGSIVEAESAVGSDPDSNITGVSESLSPAFSLLSTILASPDFQVSDSISLILRNLKFDIDYLLPRLPSALVQPATTSSMLLEITLSDPDQRQTKPTLTFPGISDLESHRQAINNIFSPLAPVQAEGLSTLSQLIDKASPVLDIPATLTLLLSVLTASDESAATDEFLYLNVIKLIGSLASKHPRTVIKTLAERYADRSEESTLDQRLKIGEALLRTIQNLGGALVGDAARVLGDVMIEVASRRGIKLKAKDQRGKGIKKSPPAKNSEELNENITKLMNQINEDVDSETEDPVKEAYFSRIIHAWEAGATTDTAPDDLRARASAISILASAIQTNLAGLGPALASSSIDLAISTLTLESDEGSAILRRAAVILLLDLIKALDEARESGKDLGFGLSVTATSSSIYPASHQSGSERTTIGNVPDILRALNFVESRETDTIVRGHLRALIESLEAWLEKSLLWGIRTQQSLMEQPRFELGDRLAGLDIHPLSSTEKYGRTGEHPRIEEIE
ncbi:hypothetical protein CIRG_02389 [Coccidioides immitis RMSCC 2394]|uniref:Protein required for cell viability n=1 Tax=Coccidioides immitis RMSCC 2394 TaxID=404692 RepID=A0A0J7AYY9_COCIT|nr:hypothetical protein CIRG_02389 [Coccidioides immitis RMSCC 2394]